MSLLLAGLLLGSPTHAGRSADAGLSSHIDFDRAPPARSLRRLEGSFARAPVRHWDVRLPGPHLNSAAHTERGRPLIHQDTILVGSAAGKALFQLSRFDGSLLHTFDADASVEAEAAVDGDTVVFSDTSGATWCYGLDGEQRWKHEGNAPILTRPTVADGKVIVTNVDDLVVALDAATGELQWRHKAKRDLTRAAELALYAAPPAVVLDALVLVGFSDGSLMSLDLASGEERWRINVGEGRYPDLVAEPVVVGADVFASGYFKPLLAIDHGSQNVRWRAEVGAAFAPLLSDDGKTLYHAGTDGRLRAFSVLTGAEKWTWDSDTNTALTTPVQTQVGLLFGASGGGIYIVDPENGKQSWAWSEDELLEGVTATPVVSGRQMLFISNAGQLYSLLSPPPSTRDAPSNRFPFDGLPSAE